MISQTVLTQAALSVIARRRIAPWLRATPCIRSRSFFDDGSSLFFKAENFQNTGSFKFRGALSKLTSLSTDVPVITASSGNHGIALATAAQQTGHTLTVVLPETVAREKLARIENLGVEIVLHSDDPGKAELHAQHLANERGNIYVSPYDDDQVIAGQGTAALELLEQQPDLDMVYISMGGGGLISGMGAVIKAYAPKTRVVGVSAINSAALAASIRAGKVVEVEHRDTIADGVAGGLADRTRTLPLAVDVVDDLIDCTEDQIAEGVKIFAWDEKMLVEGAAGLALAGWLADRSANAGKKSAVLVCGANFDRTRISPIIGAGS